ncbi:MAG: RNA polymerase sigma factor [Gaiellales bacterium]
MRRRDPLRHPDELAQRVYAYVAYRIGPGPDAEDVTSDVFERALRYRRSYDPGRGSPVTWLIGIARRELAERAGQREVPVGDLPDQPDDGRLEHDSVERLGLQAAMATLSPRDRELLALRYGGDLTAAQIAALLDMQTNATEVALHRALGRLRAVMDPAPEAPTAAAQAQPACYTADAESR